MVSLLAMKNLIQMALGLVVALLSVDLWAATVANACGDCGKPAPIGWALCQKCQQRRERASKDRLREAARETVREIASVVPADGPLKDGNGRELERTARIEKLCGYVLGHAPRLTGSKVRVDETNGDFVVTSQLKRPFRSCRHVCVRYARANRALYLIELWSDPVMKISEARANSELAEMARVIAGKFAGVFDAERPTTQQMAMDDTCRTLQMNFSGDGGQSLTLTAEKVWREKKGTLRKENAPKDVGYVFRIRLEDRLVPTLFGGGAALQPKGDGADAL